MNIFLTGLGFMLICATGVASIAIPIWAFCSYDMPDGPREEWLANHRWWLAPSPFIVIPLLVAIVVGTGIMTADNATHCGPGTRYVEHMDTRGDTEWWCTTP